MPETSYEQHVFGLELQDKFLGPLAKSAKLLEKNAAAWDKFEARVRGGGMDKAMAKVNGLIGRYEKLEQVIKRIGGVKVNAGGGTGGRSGADPATARRKYEVWWDSQLRRQDAQGERAAQRAAARVEREELKFSAYRIRLDRKEAAEKESNAARAAQAAAKAEASAMASITGHFGEIGGGFLNAAGKSGGFLGDIAKFADSNFAGALGAGLSVAKMGLTAIVDVMKYGWEYGKLFVTQIVDAAKERGLLMTALEVQLGSREQADKQLNKTLDIAQLTPASNQQVVDLTKRLYGAQMKGGRLDATRAAWADMQAFGGNAAAEKVAFWTSRVASRGTALTAAVSGFGKAGVSERFIREEMAKKLGSKVGYKPGGAYTDKMDAAVQEAISDKQVSSAVFEEATQRAILRVLKQNQLGAYAKKKGVESLAGVLSNVEEMIPTFLMRLNIDQFAGIQQLKKFLGDVLSFFSLGTKEGKLLAGIIEDLTNEILGGLKNITRDDMSKFFYDAAEAAKTLIIVVRDIWGVIDKTIHGGSFADIFAGAADVFMGIGKMIGQGIYAGIHQVLEENSAVVRYWGDKGWTNLGNDLTAKGTVGGWFKNKLGGSSEPAKAPSTASFYANDQSFSSEQTQSLPHYGAGGVVPGPYGKPRLAIVHGGEEYLGSGGSRRADSGGGGATFENCTFNVICDSMVTRDNFAQVLQECIEDETEAAA